MWFWAVISMWTIIKAVGRDDSAQGKQVQSKDGVREEPKGHLHVGDRPRKGSHKQHEGLWSEKTEDRQE